MSDLEAGVPQAVEDLLGHVLHERVHLPGVKKQEIDVRRRVELAAAVPPLREDGAALFHPHVAPSEVSDRRIVQVAQNAIDDLGVCGDDFASGGSREVPGE